MSKGIHISPKHGVNPCIPRCFFCGEDKNEVALLGRLPNDAEAPRHAILDHEPCDKCRAFMDRGIILISVRDGGSGDNPYRTGGFWVITEDAFRRIFDGPPVEQALRLRFAFLEDTVCERTGLTKPQPNTTTQP